MEENITIPKELFNSIKQTLLEYSNFTNWSRCSAKNNFYTNMWYPDGDGFTLARAALKQIEKYESSISNR